MIRIDSIWLATEPMDMQAACASYFEDGWLAWELSDLRPVTPSVAIRAARGIYEVDFLLPDKR